jgi:copper chaperone CopZ
MKQLILIAALVIGVQMVQAQVTPKALRADIATPHATCDPCKVKIESFVSKSIDGLVKINVQVKRGITQVQYFPDRTNIDEIRTAITNAGFDADDEVANPDTYKRLPACCKKPEDK